MKILFLLGDSAPRSIERQLAAEAYKIVTKDAEAVWGELVPLSSEALDGVWIFTHEEDGGCPPALFCWVKENLGRLREIPVAISGIGGKEGGMNAVTELSEFLSEADGRFFEDFQPVCIPLKGTRLDLEHDEKWDLIWYADAFIKYCGMDESESRRIGFERVVENFFALIKFLCKDGLPQTIKFDEQGDLVTDLGVIDWQKSDLPAELRELRYEIDELVADYEIEEEEILSALQKKLHEN